MVKVINLLLVAIATSSIFYDINYYFGVTKSYGYEYGT